MHTLEGWYGSCKLEKDKKKIKLHFMLVNPIQLRVRDEEVGTPLSCVKTQRKSGQSQKKPGIDFVPLPSGPDVRRAHDFGRGGSVRRYEWRNVRLESRKREREREAIEKQKQNTEVS